MLYVEPSWLDDHARALLGAAAAFDGPVIRDPALCAQWLAALAPQDMDEAGRAERISAALFARCCAGTRAPPGRWRPRMRMSATSCARAWRRIRPARRTWRRWRAQARHRTTLVKQFARRYGLPPQAWLRNWRVARARELLRGGLPLADAAHAVGFADQAHMTRVFKQVYGSTPGVFRKASAAVRLP